MIEYIATSVIIMTLLMYLGHRHYLLRQQQWRQSNERKPKHPA